MRRLVLVVLYLLGGVGSVQQSSLIDLNFTQRTLDSYLVFCTPQLPEERVFQVHWKEEHANGTYSMIAVLNPHWGNYSKFSYQEEVTLHKREGKTYMIEIMTLKMCVCCEVVTFPSGSIHESCITIDEDSNAYNLQYALLATLLVGGFFFLGSVVLVCHICWMRKTHWVFNLRGARQQLLTRSQGSQVPYRRSSPSVNLAYETSHDTDTPPPTRAHLQHTLPTSQPPSVGLPPRNTTVISHWPSEEPCPTPPNVTMRNQVTHQVLPALQPIYTNVLHRNKRYPKIRNVKDLQIEQAINPHQREMLSHDGMDPSLTLTHYHANAHPWLFEGASYSSEDLVSPHSSRLTVPRTPESPFTTINPMYHTATGWTSHHKNPHLKYEHSMIS
ncbi:uncharacterized protein [Dendropsophus ebraccatus]|uniref:uncharacterized protein isoform X2 n=1 Tax=Dendropsophus ebraccatus TaxID=150705 RepID=UPI003831AE1F